MAIVAAAVRNPGHFRSVGQRGSFVNGQGVHVRPKGDRSLVFSLWRIEGIKPRALVHDLKICAVRDKGHEVRLCPGFPARKLRMPVQGVAQSNNLL